MSQHLAVNEVNSSIMVYYRPCENTAVLLPSMTYIHDLDFLGYLYIKLSSQVQISGILLETPCG